MATTISADTIILDLDTHTANEVVLEPAFQYENIAQNTLGVYMFKFGQDKLRMTHLSKPGNMLQPRSGCDTWNPTIRLSMRPDEIVVSDYEVNGEQCPDEFDEGCLRNLRGDMPWTFPNYGPELTALDRAMIEQVRRGLVDDIYKVAHFGDQSIRLKLAAGDINLDHLSPDQKENFLVQMEVTDGWWTEIEGRAYSSDPYQKVRYVDSNNGTLAGNATVPANVAAFLRKLRMTSSMVLRNWNRSGSIEQRPMYLVQPGIFQALLQYYQGLGLEQSFAYIREGAPVLGVLRFENHLVVEIPEWDVYDFETGNMDETTGYSKKQRALFIAPENLTGVANFRNLQSIPGSGLVVQNSPVLRDKGKKFIYYAFGMGFGLAQPQLVTAAWNSSDTYVTS
jgi:hypothetical protein